MSDFYTIELRVYLVSGTPNDVSCALGLRPTSERQKGDSAGPGKTFNETMWGYGQQQQNGALIEWLSFDDGVRSLLEELRELLPKLLELKKQGHETLLWCGHFHESFGSGPTVSVNVMRELVEFDLSLNIFTYGYYGESPSLDL